MEDKYLFAYHATKVKTIVIHHYLPIPYLVDLVDVLHDLGFSSLVDISINDAINLSKNISHKQYNSVWRADYSKLVQSLQESYK